MLKRIFADNFRALVKLRAPAGSPEPLAGREWQRAAGPAFPFRPDQSFLLNIDAPGAKQMARLAEFKEFMAELQIVQPNPFSIEDSSQQDQFFLTRNGSNFASFFSYLNSERPNVRTELERRLSEALPDFLNLFFRRVGDAKFLLARS